VISEAKMQEIIDFILQGKYSSACVLLLEETGHEPLHYIPYRTYNRLQKQRLQEVKSHNAAVIPSSPPVTPLKKRIADLDYIESLADHPSSPISGGNARWSFKPVKTNCQNGNFDAIAADILSSVPRHTPAEENCKWISIILTI